MVYYTSVRTLVGKIFEIYRTEGVWRTLRVCWTELVKRLINFFEILYWQVKQHQTVSIEGASATFEGRVEKGGRENRKRIEAELEQLEDLLGTLSPEDVFYDIGANTGLYTCLAADVCSSGSVIAFEPYPPNIKQLIRHIEMNNLQNVQVQEVAVSDSEGEIEFQQPSQEQIAYGQASIAREGQNNTVSVATRSVDDLVETNDLPAPTVVKIDVEGAEPLVLRGMKQTLRLDSCRLVYCEYHLPAANVDRSMSSAFGMDLDDMVNTFTELGFEVTEFARKSGEITLKCEK